MGVLSTLWLQRLNSGFIGLVVGAFTCWAILLAWLMDRLVDWLRQFPSVSLLASLLLIFHLLILQGCVTTPRFFTPFSAYDINPIMFLNSEFPWNCEYEIEPYPWVGPLLWYLACMSWTVQSPFLSLVFLLVTMSPATSYSFNLSSASMPERSLPDHQLLLSSWSLTVLPSLKESMLLTFSLLCGGQKLNIFSSEEAPLLH